MVGNLLVARGLGSVNGQGLVAVLVPELGCSGWQNSGPGTRVMREEWDAGFAGFSGVLGLVVGFFEGRCDQLGFMEM